MSTAAYDGHRVEIVEDVTRLRPSARRDGSLTLGNARNKGIRCSGTGFPQADAENDFLRARPHQFLAALTDRLRGRPVDSSRLLPLDEIIGSLGWRSQRQLGLQTIRLDTIVGTAGARRDFDCCFRPTAGRVRSRWSGWRWPSGAVRRSRRSRSTAWAIGISSATVTTGYL